MPTNPIFNNFNFTTEQNLIEDLVIESIKIFGIDVRYLPRTIVNEDKLFGEDLLSTFNAAAEVEMYVKNVEGFEGEGDFLSRFNIEIRDEMTLTVARKRYDQMRTEKLLAEDSYNLKAEDGSGILLETGDGAGYSVTSERPLEGDLIYFPLTNKLYEIKFVEHESVFYQMGSLQMYDLRCELFEYSHERFATSNTEINAIESELTLDLLEYELLAEDGTKLLAEDGGSIILEGTAGFAIANNSPTADNDAIQDMSDEIMVFNDTNPFGDEW